MHSHKAWKVPCNIIIIIRAAAIKIMNSVSHIRLTNGNFQLLLIFPRRGVFIFSNGPQLFCGAVLRAACVKIVTNGTPSRPITVYFVYQTIQFTNVAAGRPLDTPALRYPKNDSSHGIYPKKPAAVLDIFTFFSCRL